MKMKFTSLIYYSLLITGVFSIDILKKYGSLKTSGQYVIFESSGFNIGESMYFTIKREMKFDSFMYYKYADNIDGVDTTDFHYFKSSNSESSTKVNGRITSHERYYSIEKKNSEFDGTNGNYLVLKIPGFGEYEIENTKSSGATTIIIIVVVFVVVVIIIVVACIIFNRYRARKMMLMRANRMPYGVAGYPQPMYPVYGNSQYMYQNPAMYANMYQNPPVMINTPMNVQVLQRDVNVKLPDSSMREVNDKYEKPKINNQSINNV